MSSHIDSSYYVERRRLERIVRQCCEAVENAKKAIDVQKEKMRLEKLNRAKEEMCAEQNLVETKRIYNAQISNEVERNKEIVESFILKIKNSIFEMKSYQKLFDCQFESLKEMSDLLKLVSEMNCIEGEFEHEVNSIISNAKKEFFEKSQLHFSNRESNETGLKKRRKTALLNLESESKVNKSFRRQAESPAQRFEEILESAKKYSSYERVIGCNSVVKTFLSLETYEKDVYALKNMDALLSLLDRLEKVEKQASIDAGEGENTIQEYIALCGFLNIPVDNVILSERNVKKVKHLNEKMMNEYINRKKRDYVAQAIRRVMEERGVEFQDQSDTGELVFRSNNAGVIVTEYEADYLEIQQIGFYAGEVPSVNDKRKSIIEAQRVCSMMAEIKEELANKYGIVFCTSSVQKPDEKMKMYQQTSWRDRREYIRKKSKKMSK